MTPQDDLYWTTWNAATDAVQRYEATGELEHRTHALAALRVHRFPNDLGLRARIHRADIHNERA